jgi:dCMP deaminase
MVMADWDQRFLALAQHVAQWSKDPSTKVGAVIVDPERRIVSLGYNGFARGVLDTVARYADRDEKLRMVVHADANALLFARGPIRGCTLYTWPMLPCAQCAALAINAGIVRVVAPHATPAQTGRWGDSLAATVTMFREADVLVDIVRRGTA